MLFLEGENVPPSFFFRLKRAWALIAKRCAEHYGLEETVPKGWKKVLDGEQSNAVCSVCLDDFTEEEQQKQTKNQGRHVVETPCKHTFHVSCIDECLRRDANEGRCPNCRSSLDGFNPWFA